MIKIHERCGCGAEITATGQGASTVVDKWRREHQHPQFAAGGIVQPNSGASLADARASVQAWVNGL